MDTGPGYPWVDVRLPDAGYPFIGMNFDNNVILRRAGRANVITGI